MVVFTGKSKAKDDVQPTLKTGSEVKSRKKITSKEESERKHYTKATESGV